MYVSVTNTKHGLKYAIIMHLGKEIRNMNNSEEKTFSRNWRISTKIIIIIIIKLWQYFAISESYKPVKLIHFTLQNRTVLLLSVHSIYIAFTVYANFYMKNSLCNKIKKCYIWLSTCTRV